MPAADFVCGEGAAGGRGPRCAVVADMTPRAKPLSEKGKVYAVCILFPIFWPFLPALLICDLCEAIRDWWQRPAKAPVCSVCGSRHWPIEECDLQ